MNIENKDKMKKMNALRDYTYASHICIVRYDGSYSMIAKPMKTLELQ